MGTVTVITAERALALAAESVVSGVIDVDGDLILTKQDGTTVNAGNVGSQIGNARPFTDADIPLNGSGTDQNVETVTITDDGTDTTTWVNRLAYKFLPVGGTARNTFYLNEYGEIRVAPAKETTTAFRAYVKYDPNNPAAARSATTPVIELVDDPVNRNNLWGILGDGSLVRKGIKMASLLVLGAVDPVPAGTPAGTLIFRQSSAPPLNLNPYFEVDASHWTAAGGTLSRDTSVFKNGVASGKIVATGGIATVSFTSDRFPVAAGNLYRISAWLRPSVAGPTYLTVNWYNASNTFLSANSSSISAPANTWVQLQSMALAPAGATQASIAPNLQGTPAAGVILNADDVIMGV